MTPDLDPAAAHLNAALERLERAAEPDLSGRLAAEVLGRLHGEVIKLDRAEFGEQYALAVSCAYQKVEGLINQELRGLRGVS